MHTQTVGVPEHPARVAPSLHVATGLGLYLLTLAGEAVLGAGVRWLLTYLGASALGAFLPLGPGADQLALAAALAPLAWSLLALPIPGGTLIWRRRLGARRPSAEEAMTIEDAIAILRSSGAEPIDPRDVFILDDPLPHAAVYGRAVILSRGLLQSEGLSAVLAHELGHASTLDGRLTEALQRLRLSPDRLRAREDEIGSPSDGGLLLGCARWVLRLAAGGCAESLLRPAWAAYWRSREYAADAYAASLGQAHDLARHLGDYQQPLDAPQRCLLFNRFEHPPVALRIERVLVTEAGRGSE